MHSRPALFDAHLHIIDPHFPLVANDGYVPDPFTVSDYRSRTASLEVIGGAVVSGSFQAFDQAYLLDALSRLGPAFVGVTQLPMTVSDEEILVLATQGVRAVRFNLHRRSSLDRSEIETLAHRVYDLAQWHAEFYVDSSKLEALLPLLTDLPKVCIDHLGLSSEGRPYLLRLVEAGAHVKASAFGHLKFDIRSTLREIAQANPSALMVGTDLPSTRAPRPFIEDDLDLVVDALGPDLAEASFSENALAFYRPDNIRAD